MLRFMKVDKVNLILGIITLLDFIVLLIIYLCSIGYDKVVSYNEYVIYGFEAFLILEDIQLFFYICLILLILLIILIIYRTIYKK